MEPDKAALTIPEFCTLYGIGRTFTYEEIGAGRLRVRKAGKRTLIRKVDADDWLNSLPETPTKGAA